MATKATKQKTPTNITRRRSGIWVYRKIVPIPLRDFVGSVEGFEDRSPRTEFIQSLNTTDQRTAIRLAIPIDMNVERALREARTARAAGKALDTIVEGHLVRTHIRITPEQAILAIESWRDQELDQAKINVFNGLHPNRVEVSFAQHDLQSGFYKTRETGGREGWQDVPGFDTALADACASTGLRIEADHPAVSFLRAHYAAAWLDIRAEERGLAAGNFCMPQLRKASFTEAAAQQSVPLLPKTATAFLEHATVWHAQTRLSSRHASMYLSDLRQFAANNPGVSIETTTKVMVQAWVDDLHPGIEVPTIKRKLAAIRNYWDYLQRKGLVPEENRPFHGLHMPRINSVTRAENATRAFARVDIPKFWALAERSGRHDLASVIKIAAYTGARLESVVDLKIKSFHVDKDTGIRLIHFSDKTGAGVRDVPLHSAIAPLVDRLIASADKEGHLIHVKGSNAHGRRSNGISMAFGRMKTNAGFDRRFVFHSIRKTYATMVKAEARDESITEELLGHEHKGMAHGRYARHTNLVILSQIVERGVGYPEANLDFHVQCV